jgi:hypothetical protein
LFSPGKGIFWYFPALWLGVAFVGRWRRDGRLPDYLLAAGAALALIVVYALWYDWPGGRAWGPRMIITATPALTILALPALDWLLQGRARAEVNRHVDVPADLRSDTRSPSHILVAAILLLSVTVQLPGVLVNFERQEGLDMQAGATFDQLLWSPAQSPLLTYWQRIGATPDPLWLQPYLRTLSPVLPLSLAAAAILAAVALALAARRIRRCQRVGWRLGLAAVALTLMALLLPPLAYADPRWDELSAVREDNQAVMRDVQAAWQAGDVVLLDLLESSDKERRTGQWLNFARREPYIGWLRKAPMQDPADEQLAAWLAPYRRAWLLLQKTDEGDPASTTEAWLNRWAFSGRRWWVGDQRVVEYLLPPEGAEAGATGGPFTFGAGPVLDRYQLVQDAHAAWLSLDWQATADAGVRYSVQALDAANVVLAQVDGAPAAAGSGTDRIGLSLPDGVERLILKLYRADDGQVLPVVSPRDAEAADFLLLTHP